MKIEGSGSRSINPLVRGMDPRIRIHTKMSWIRNTGKYDGYSSSAFILEVLVDDGQGTTDAAVAALRLAADQFVKVLHTTRPVAIFKTK